MNTMFFYPDYFSQKIMYYFYIFYNINFWFIDFFSYARIFFANNIYI